MRKLTRFFSLTVAIAVVSMFILCSPGLVMAGATGSTAFFSQGQSAYDPQDNAKSQQLAIRDFMVHGLTQAIGKFLSPTQIGTQFPEIQKKILAQPSKYIDSYQVFSENQSGGLYLVVGQVSVTMDVLRKDLADFGFPVAGEPQAQSGTETHTISNARPDNYNQEDQEDQVEVADDAEEPSKEPVKEEPREITVPPRQQQAPLQRVSRGLSVTKREIFWVVPEKWEQEWVLPSDRRDAHSLFVRSIGKELDGYDISIQLPDAGALKMDISGRIPPSQIQALAEALGIQTAVVGTVSYREDQNTRQAWLETDLHLIRFGANKSETVIRKAQSMEELSNQEGALELASRVAPQISTLLGKAEVERKPATAGGAQETGPATSPGGVQGMRWTINMPSAQYPYWKEVEKILRERFRDMQISSLEVGSSEGTVKVDGIDGSFISRMNGTSLPSGAQVKVDSYSAEAQTIKISFSPPGKGSSESR